MNTLTFTTTDHHDTAIQFALDAHNMTLPRSAETGEIINPLTFSDFAQLRIRQLFDGLYDFYLEATAEQQKRNWLAEQRGQLVLSGLEQGRQAKLVELHGAYSAQLSAGIAPAGSQLVLAAQELDVAKFTQLITLLRELEEMQPTQEAKDAFQQSQITIVDIDSAPHQVTVSTLRAMMVDYGNQVNALWGTYATKRAQALSATTVEELDAIDA